MRMLSPQARSAFPGAPKSLCGVALDLPSPIRESDTCLLSQLYRVLKTRRRWDCLKGVEMVAKSSVSRRLYLCWFCRPRKKSWRRPRVGLRIWNIQEGVSVIGPVLISFSCRRVFTVAMCMAIDRASVVPCAICTIRSMKTTLYFVSSRQGANS